MRPRFPLTLAALLALIALFAVAPASAMATEEVAAAPEVAQATAPLPAGEVESDNSAPFLDEPPEDFRPRGPFVSVGYGLHRYAMKSLSMEQDSNDRRLFDGAALSIQAGYLSSWGGLVGVDWAHHSGKTTLNTLAASMSLRLRTDFLSLLAGMQFGGRIRFHLALLAGVALAQLLRGKALAASISISLKQSSVWVRTLFLPSTATFSICTSALPTTIPTKFRCVSTQQSTM